MSADERNFRPRRRAIKAPVLNAAGAAESDRI
jgi:hypothetical protein